MPTRDRELELEDGAFRALEGEFETEDEALLEGEGLFEEEDEFENEGEFEREDELESEWLGEFEDELETEGYLEGEAEAEEFIRRMRALARRAAPMMKRWAPTLARIAATTLAGPAAGALAGRLASGLVQQEGEFELEDEFEDEAPSAEANRARAVAEMLATAAARTPSEAEAEAYVGAATAQVLSAQERRELQLLLPNLLRAAAVLTRYLRRQRLTRPVVATVPAIVAGTARDLSRRRASGRTVDQRVAARAMARQTRRVLGDPRVLVGTVTRSARTATQVSSPAGMPRVAAPYPPQRAAGLRIGQLVTGRTASGALVAARVVPVRRAPAGTR